MAEDIICARYPAFDDLISARHPRSGTHDELLFIVIHQTKELWLKQAIAKVTLAPRLAHAGELTEAYSRWRACPHSLRTPL